MSHPEYVPTFTSELYCIDAYDDAHRVSVLTSSVDGVPFEPGHLIVRDWSAGGASAEIRLRYAIFEKSDLHFSAEITYPTDISNGSYDYVYLSIFGGLLLFRTDASGSIKPGAYPKWHFTHDGYYDGFGERLKKYTLHTDIGDGKVKLWNGGDLQFLSALDYERPPVHFVLQGIKAD